MGNSPDYEAGARNGRAEISRSKKYYPFVGIGYVQLTWRENYQKASDKLSVDFVSNPKLLLEQVHATEILVLGMKEGWFTGKKLSDYITLKASDFVEARRIINGKDKASDIAREYDGGLKVEGYGESTTVILLPKLNASGLGPLRRHCQHLVYLIGGCNWHPW